MDVVLNHKPNGVFIVNRTLGDQGFFIGHLEFQTQRGHEETLSESRANTGEKAWSFNSF